MNVRWVTPLGVETLSTSYHDLNEAERVFVVDRFVQALVFNWLIAGTDAPNKNYGLVLSGIDARVAPLYDVASALVDWKKFAASSA